MAGFSAIDYVIFVTIFAACIAIGIYHGYVGRRQGTTSAYLMGDRKLALVPVTVSMVVSVLSANTLLGVPAETYSYGMQIVLKAFGTAIGGILAAVVFVPLLYPLKITSTYEYLEMRFHSKWVRGLGSLLLIITQCFYTGSVIVGAAVAFQSAVGLPGWASVIIISVLGSIDTAAGGFKGVIWTDVFQCVIMLIGLIIVLVKGVSKVGGVSQMWSINKDWGRIYISLDTDPTERINLLSGLVGFAFLWWAFYGVNQPQVQRYSSLQTRTKAITAMLLNPFGFFIFHVLSVFTGLVVAAYYITIGCDPIRAKYISNPNQLLMYFVMDAFEMSGLPGAFVSCLFCAALSSQSSSLNSMAAVLWEDFLSVRYSHWSNKEKANLLRMSVELWFAPFYSVVVLVFGVLAGFIAVMMIFIGGNLQQLAVSFNSISLGPLLGMFLLGAFVPLANAKGTFIGGLVSLILCCWLLAGQIIYKTQRLKLPAPTHNCTAVLYDYQLYNDTTTSILTSTMVGEAGTFPSTIRTMSLTGPVIKSGVHWLYSVSFVWFAMIGCLLTLVIGIVVSVLTGCERKRKVPKRLFSHIIHPFIADDTEDEDDKHKSALVSPSEKTQERVEKDYDEKTFLQTDL